MIFLDSSKSSQFSTSLSLSLYVCVCTRTCTLTYAWAQMPWHSGQHSLLSYWLPLSSSGEQNCKSLVQDPICCQPLVYKSKISDKFGVDMNLHMWSCKCLMSVFTTVGRYSDVAYFQNIVFSLVSTKDILKVIFYTKLRAPMKKKESWFMFILDKLT